MNVKHDDDDDRCANCMLYTSKLMLKEYYAQCAQDVERLSKREKKGGKERERAREREREKKSLIPKQRLNTYMNEGCKCNE